MARAVQGFSLLNRLCQVRESSNYATESHHPNSDKPEKKPLNHDGHNVAQRKILNALTSCSVVAFGVNSLLFAQGFNLKVPKRKDEAAG